MKSGKIWGTTQPIFHANNVEVHRIAIVPGGFCSKHKHLNKWNLFYIESGELVVENWRVKSGLCDETTVSAGETFAVPPGEFHRFRALTDVVAYEIYWTELDPNDITRETVGGISAEPQGRS